MRACIQRVRRAKVTVEGRVTGAIDQGFLVLLGVGKNDTDEELKALANKIAGLRVFEDEEGKMNRSIDDVGGAMLIVSQFTLWGDCRKGRRPSFTDAAPPEMAEALYDRFVAMIAERGIPTQTGVFRAEMDVELVNDGPVTLWIDTDDWK